MFVICYVEITAWLLSGLDVKYATYSCAKEPVYVCVDIFETSEGNRVDLEYVMGWMRVVENGRLSVSTRALWNPYYHNCSLVVVC